MKILVVTQYFFPENFRINTLCIELKNRGHKVTVLTGYPQYPKGKIYDGYGFTKKYDKNWNGLNLERVKILPRGKTPIGLFLNCFSTVWAGNYWAKRTKEKFDIVYVYGLSPITIGLPAVTYKKRMNVPILFNVQDLWPDSVEQVLGVKNKLILNYLDRIVKKIYNSSDKILCTSKGFIEKIEEKGINKEKIMYYPQFYSKPDLISLIKPKELKEKTFNIVFAGNIGEAQGLELLIDAMDQLKGQDINSYFVGDGRTLQNLKQKVEELALQNQIYFIGKVSENKANEYIYYADAAYISLKDNVILDITVPAKMQTYLACGTPIIGAVNGQSRDIIEQAKCGIHVEKDKSKLAKAILELKNKSKEEIKTIRENANKYFEENFEKEKLINLLEEEMIRILKK